MSSKTASARPGHDRASLYDEITGKIIAELEAGRVPWVQPWGTAAAKAPLAMPKNAATGRQYSGINVLILWGAVIEHGFPAQSWLTFRQALSLGGNVRKGDLGARIRLRGLGRLSFRQCDDVRRLRRGRLIRLLQEARRDIPVPSIGSNNGHGFAIVAGQRAFDRMALPVFKRHTFADRKFKHGLMRVHLMEKAQSLDDPVI